MDADEKDLLKLAVALKKLAEGEDKWDANIDEFNTDIEITEEMLSEFNKAKEFYAESIDRRNILNKTAIISKQLIEENWKVGIMSRERPSRETDSGWYFGVGNESEEYLANPDNFTLAYVANVWERIDPDIIRYITNPIGSQLIRVSSSEFEIDDHVKEIYCEKRS